eukprot:546753-Prorocentrum_minimum.AAC.1
MATATMELKTINKHGRSYLIMPDGVGIPFKVFGNENDGPACILTPGGKQGIALESNKAKQLAKLGFRALVHDRRNTGAADFGVGDGSMTELELQVDDTLRLIKHVGMTPCVFIGESSGGRMSLLCALKEPSGRCGMLACCACASIPVFTECVYPCDQYYHGVPQQIREPILRNNGVPQSY